MEQAYNFGNPGFPSVGGVVVVGGVGGGGVGVCVCVGGWGLGRFFAIAIFMVNKLRRSFEISRNLSVFRNRKMPRCDFEIKGGPRRDGERIGIKPAWRPFVKGGREGITEVSMYHSMVSMEKVRGAEYADAQRRKKGRIWEEMAMQKCGGATQS